MVQTWWTYFKNVLFANVTVAEGWLDWAKSRYCGDRLAYFFAYSSYFSYFCVNCKLFYLIGVQRQSSLLAEVLKSQSSFAEINFTLWSVFISVFNSNLGFKNIPEDSLSKINRILKYDHIWLFGLDVKWNEDGMRTPDKNFNMIFIVLEISRRFKFYCN